MTASVPSAARMAAIAANTFRESVRQRFFLVPGSIAVALGIASWCFRNCSIVASQEKFVLDTGFGALTFFGTVVAIVAAAESLSRDIESRTVLAVLAKPVWRGEYVVGKLAGIFLLLATFCSVCAGFLIGWLWFRQAQTADPLVLGSAGAERASSFAVMACCFVQWLRCIVLAALTMMVATYARNSLLAVMAGFAALAICSLRGLVLDAFLAAGPGWARSTARLAGLAVPNFELYDVADRVAAGGVLSTGYLVGITSYTAIYGCLFVALAVYCFQHREL